MRISQCYSSSSMGFFAAEFRRLWGLTAYNNPDQPALFFGAYKERDIEVINAHRGFKLFVIGGSDLKNLPRLKNVYVAVSEGDYMRGLYPLYGPPKQKLLEKPIAIKSFEGFKPTALGDKIYIYLGREERLRSKEYDYPLYHELVKRYGHRVISAFHGRPLQEVKEKVYPKVLVNVQLNPWCGWTTALELAHMGRRTISVRKAPICITYENLHDIICSIDKELDRFGEVRNDVAEIAQNSLMQTDDWLHTIYYA